MCMGLSIGYTCDGTHKSPPFFPQRFSVTFIYLSLLYTLISTRMLMN